LDAIFFERRREEQMLHLLSASATRLTSDHMMKTREATKPIFHGLHPEVTNAQKGDFLASDGQLVTMDRQGAVFSGAKGNWHRLLWPISPCDEKTR